MPLLVNLRHLEDRDLDLNGELTAEELELTQVDDVIHATKPLSYKLQVQKLAAQILVEGTLDVPLECECVRCLKPFTFRLHLSPWTCYLPLEGEEKVAVANDCVDLTPFIREDILLEFPRHPLCKANCSGLPAPSKASDQTQTASPWSELNKLKF